MTIVLVAGAVLLATWAALEVAVRLAFGVPHVAEDDAIRAVRAAVAVQDAFRQFAREEREIVGETGLRVAVNTGEVDRAGALRGAGFNGWGGGDMKWIRFHPCPCPCLCPCPDKMDPDPFYSGTGTGTGGVGSIQ